MLYPGTRGGGLTLLQRCSQCIQQALPNWPMGKRKKSRWSRSVLLQRCSIGPETAGWSVYWDFFFKHAEIFMDNLLNTVLFHVQLTCDYLKVNLPYPLDLDLSPFCLRPYVIGVIFHLLTPLFESLVSLKNTCVWHGVISIHLMKHFKCLWRSFFQLDQKFQAYLFFNAYRWTPWNWECKQKHEKKKCNGCRKLRL